ncbi:MAG TPA: hypothetical protein VK667_12380, partial [Ktedonobacteraceae bacterium]|nr:hypothetical protein [Ktedonobacteraceae bacterium]
MNFSTAVILSSAKDLRSAQREILSVAKDDRYGSIKHASSSRHQREILSVAKDDRWRAVVL